MLTFNSYGTEYKIKLQISSYENGNFALCATYYDEDYKYWGPYGTFTVNLDEKLPDDCAYVDTNNMPTIEDWLKDNGLAEPLAKNRQSGFCMYPLYKFNIAKIRSIIAKQDNEDE